MAYRLQALVAEDRLSEALRILPFPLPDNLAICELATSLLFRMNDYVKCVGTTKKLAEMKTVLSPVEQFIYAESLYKTEHFAESETAFMAVTKENDFYQQSLYRLAQLARRKNNEQKALSLFEKIVETDKNSLWKQYAERELQFAKAEARM